MAVNIGKLNSPMLYNYTYDQLNRITGMDAFKGLDGVNNNWNGLTATQEYRERVAYDGNGNILRYLRNGFGTKLSMDSLTYKYSYDSIGRLVHNKLNWVRDSVGDAEYAEDIDRQEIGNYSYDAIGNMIADTKAGINSIEWTVYGKIAKITKGSGTTISYTYDASGNRISKKVQTSGGEVKYTWYARDAQGNVMATYVSAGSGNTLNSYSLKLEEQHLYGSSRMGIVSREVDMKTTYTAPNMLIFKRGQKQYELSNHLGNVLATISDKKKGIASASNSSLIDYYEADVVTAQDYYPFGMLMPGRRGYSSSTGWNPGSPGSTLPQNPSYNGRSGNTPLEYKATKSIEFIPGFESGEGDSFEAYITQGNGSGGEGSELAGSSIYRYGFNGKENDDEVKGEGNQQDYGMRIYDPRLGKFLSVDPLAPKYPQLTPYQYASNTPVSAVDIDGEESKISIQATRQSNPQINNTEIENIFRQTDMQMKVVNWLIPQLKIPGTDIKGHLSEQERNTVINETVSAYLSFNYSEQMTYNSSGIPDKQVERINADLNYDLAFGSNTDSKIELVKQVFEYGSLFYGWASDATGKNARVNTAFEVTGLAQNVLDGDYFGAGTEIVEKVAEKFVDVGTKSLIERGLLPATAEIIAPRLLGTIVNTVTPLDAGGPTVNDTKLAGKKIETEQIQRNVVAAMMYYFLTNNGATASDAGKKLQGEQKQRVDNTRTVGGNRVP